LRFGKIDSVVIISRILKQIDSVWSREKTAVARKCLKILLNVKETREKDN
jgi:hypothetical protein